MHTTTTIYSPGISLADVNYVLGAGSLDVGTLCQHGNINKWAKYKPIALNKLAVLAYDDFKNATYPFGLALPKAAKIRDIGVKPSNYSNYVYHKTGTSDHKRITDFDGYDHTCVKPFTCAWQSDTNTVNAFDTAELLFGCQGQRERLSSANIVISDLYLGSSGLPVVFTVELYRNAQDIATQTPFLWVASPNNFLGSEDSALINLTVLEIKNAYKSMYNATLTAGTRVEAFFGLNRLTATGSTKLNSNNTANHFTITASDVSGSDAMPAPWASDSDLSVMYRNFTLADYVSFESVINRYWVPNINGSSGYISISASRTQVRTADIGIEITIKNTSTSKAVRAIASSAYGNTSSTNVLFRARARGIYTTQDPAYNNSSEGHIISAKLRETASGGNVNFIDIPANSSKTIYLYMEGLLPLGETQGVNVEASSDGGTTWVIVTSASAPLTRIV